MAPKFVTKILDKITPSNGTASDAELRQRELTRERINSMTAEDKDRVHKQTQERAKNVTWASGGGGLVQ